MKYKKRGLLSPLPSSSDIIFGANIRIVYDLPNQLEFIIFFVTLCRVTISTKNAKS